MQKFLVIGSVYTKIKENETLVTSESSLNEVIDEDFDHIQIRFSSKNSPMYYYYRRLERLYKFHKIKKGATNDS